jgi:hypothetical protein
MSTNAAPVPKPGHQLWGIYYTDREFARISGDPLRTVVEARTKLAAEETAARLGFGDAWAHPITAEQAKQAQWLPEHRKHRHQLAQKPSRGIHI